MSTAIRQADRAEGAAEGGLGRILATGLLSLTLVVVSVGLVVADRPIVDSTAVALWVTITGLVGWLISLRKTRNPTGWLLALGAFLALVGNVALDFAQARIADGSSGTAVSAAAWLASWLLIPGAGMFVFMLLRFPDGRLVSSRWRWVERLGILGVVLGSAALALRPGRFDATPSMDNPLGATVLEVPLRVAENIGQISLFLAGLAAVVSLVTRYRRSDHVQRQQLKWIAYAVVFLMLMIVFAGNVESAGAANEASFFGVMLGLTALPVSIGIAVLRHRLFDIDVLINRTIVYSLMTVGVIAIYVAIVGSLTGVIGSRVSLGASLVATAVVAVVFAPVREGLQRLVNRLMFGHRDDPYEVLARLGDRVEETGLPDAVLPAVARDVAESLRFPYVAIRLRMQDGFRIAAAHGDHEVHVERFAMFHHGEEVGELLVAPRPGDVALSSRDRDLLVELAKHIAPAALAVRLSSELQASRASIVRAREEERRRLRRDLHDGLGPALAGISLGLGAAERLAASEPQEAQELMARLNTQLKEAVSDLRSIVAGLVPPELERLSLVGALRERADGFSAPGRAHFEVDAPELTHLPAAAEVAAYRIALEAMTNVTKHASASRCVVTLRLEEDLMVAIADDGRGLPVEPAFGTGLTSMRERAQEIGGSLVVEPLAPQGTRVLARLPVEST